MLTESGKRHCLVLLAVSLVTVAGALAQDDPLVGDRPDFTESAVAVTPGRVQVELGATHVAVGESELAEFGELLARVGVARDLEIRLVLGSYLDFSDPDATASGWSDMGLGVKWRFLENDGARPGMAILAATSLPTGASEVTFDKAIPEAVLAAEWDLSDNLALGSNLGVAVPDDGGGRYGLGWLSAALGIGLSDRWGAFAELFGFTREEESGGSRGYGDLGVTFLVAADFQLDARVGQGFNGESTDWFWGVGAVLRH